jgi:fructuronate reductase
MNTSLSMESSASHSRLNREQDGQPVAPERIIHLGLGNFMRAHQAWYTEHAPDARQWGIAAFAGRGDKLIRELREQDGVYTLITSAPDGDDFEVISSISSVFPADDIASLRKRFADPNIVVVTSTVTEAGYMRDRSGNLDMDDAQVANDVQSLRADRRTDAITTIPARVVSGLLARRSAHCGPITILPCDNLANNGPAFRKVVEQAAQAVDPTLLAWMDNHVSWATSMVDRITPATTDAERDAVCREFGTIDEEPVRSEPFAEWVIAGDFPASRPAWEKAGAIVTNDVTPYEQRKLWMLNGSHSTLAYTGSLFGYRNVAQAIADPTLKQWVNEWWDLAAPYLSIPSDEYRAKLIERFSNPRIDHHLEQIASDGSQKLPVRIIPVAKKAIAEGRSIVPAARAIAAWALFLRDFSDSLVHDVNAETVVKLANDTGENSIRNIVAYLDGDLAASETFTEEVGYQFEEVQTAAETANSRRVRTSVAGDVESAGDIDSVDVTDSEIRKRDA